MNAPTDDPGDLSCDRDDRDGPEKRGADFVAICRADSLEDLRERFDATSIHEAYFRAKDVWRSALEREPIPSIPLDGIPGVCIRIDDHFFYVHGVTHAGTPEERSFLREHVLEYLNRGAAVYCEQGIRSLYFEDLEPVCEMDDYRWAMNECASLEAESHLEPLPERGIDALFEDVAGIASTFREATFSLIETGSSVYGNRFERALADVAAAFVTDHVDLATGKSYEAFSLSREASRNPERLVALQRYYERTFLPQPLEREWLRRHDPELEIVSHARSERMADYAMYHHEDHDEIHLVVGAAHQPGVEYYLERYREGRELPQPFELF